MPFFRDSFVCGPSPLSVSFEPVEKSQHGEGSRGGRVIGHTKSGKPIYHHSAKHYQRARDIGRPSARTQNGMRQAIHESGAHYAAKFPSYTFKDHEDAFLKHGDMANQVINPADSQEHDQAALAHHDVMFRAIELGHKKLP